jgi:hypothetical protein
MRLIDADALKNELSDKDYITYTHEYGNAIPVDWIMSAIDNAPTIKTFTLEDIEEQYRKGLEKGLSEWETERPQGEWIEKVERRGCFAGDKTVYSYTCPFCGVKEFKKYPFCHCGADMQGGRE